MTRKNAHPLCLGDPGRFGAGEKPSRLGKPYRPCTDALIENAAGKQRGSCRTNRGL